MKFEKPAKTIPEQVQLLVDRGLDVPDHSKASHYLSHLNYYRLSGYWIPFEASRAPHQFKPGASFDDVLNLYVFDRELRLLILDAIERVEVSIRTQWAYHFSHHAGAHSYLDDKFSSNRDKHREGLRKLAQDVLRSKESYIQHYLRTYTEPADWPPAWAICEVMSLGQLSYWYSILGETAPKKAIAHSYRVQAPFLKSALHALSILRNLCAHQSRVWNRQYTVVITPPRAAPESLVDAWRNNRKIYNMLCLLKHFLDVISPEHTWNQRLFTLIAEHSIDIHRMGFPSEWEDLELWGGTRT